MTGVLKLKSDQYKDSYDGALDMSNSDIFNLNSIYTADLSDTQAEGIHFYRTSTTVDTFRIANGIMYFTPNRTLGSTSSEYIVIHSGNYNSYSPKLDGTGATGTWSINITGNAATATKLQTTRTLWGQPFDGTGNVNGHITMNDEYSFKAYMPRKREGGGGWAYAPFMVRDAANSDFAHIGVHGIGNTLYYIYIGSNKEHYSAQNLRIYPDGKVYTGGNMEATSFIKKGSSDSYVLLGGGGHKELSSITASKLNSITIVSAKEFSLSNASWTDTGYTFASLDTGTYAVQVTFGTTLVASGIMSVYKNLADTAGDEIPLHVYGTAGWRPYLRTYANKLQISSNDTTNTARTVTIKIAQIL